VRRSLIALTLLVGSAFCLASNVAAAPFRGPTIHLYPIEGTFTQSTFSTTYTAAMLENGAGDGRLTIEWTITLELVDKAGSPDPTSFGSRAAVDIGCTNNGDGVGAPEVSYARFVPMDNVHTKFVWHHPDPADSVPPGRYHCNHMDEGPHGHQGLVTVTVHDNKWRCSESFKGTHSGLPVKGYWVTPNPNVTNGTASIPRCQRLG
jgi:hypothetical protein